MFPQELHRTLRLGDAEVDDALLENLLDVVLLHKDLAALQTLVFFQSSGGGGGHLIAYPWGSRRRREKKRDSNDEAGVGGGGIRGTERRGKCTDRMWRG